MVHLSDSVIINRPVEEVCRIASDVANHPKYIPYFKKCRVLARDGTHIFVERTAEINGKVFSWLGSIVFEEKNSLFWFQQVDGPLKGMTGEWIFEQVPEGTKLTITHNVVFKVPVIGKLLELYAAGNYVSKSAKNTLRSLKENIEKEK